MPRGGKRDGAGKKKDTETNKTTHTKPLMLGKSERTRNWLAIVYPDSVPDNWRDIINKHHIQWVESPLHDKDINPKFTGDEDELDPVKKAHWHILMCFPSVKSYEQVIALTDALNAPRPAPCQSTQGTIRYMVHKDNPEKYQYEWKDIIAHNGADLETLCNSTHAEVMRIQKEIIAFIRYNDITEFEDLINYCIDEAETDWYNVIANKSTLFFRTLLTSRRNKAIKREACKNKIDMLQ
ncbi:MAG: replication protein [Oscillospiraceae bacterium]|nr:replication protein [Oscillospiraceae bacterium]